MTLHPFFLKHRGDLTASSLPTNTVDEGHLTFHWAFRKDRYYTVFSMLVLPVQKEDKLHEIFYWVSQQLPEEALKGKSNHCLFSLKQWNIIIPCAYLWLSPQYYFVISFFQCFLFWCSSTVGFNLMMSHVYYSSCQLDTSCSLRNNSPDKTCLILAIHSLLLRLKMNSVKKEITAFRHLCKIQSLFDYMR